MRNRLSHLDARNKRDMADLVERLARRIGFRIAPGFGERVIFRELFLKGLTLMDLKETEADGPLTMSHIAARQEVRALVEAIDLGRGKGRVGGSQAGSGAPPVRPPSEVPSWPPASGA
jgi:chromosome partitioning protein